MTIFLVGLWLLKVDTLLKVTNIRYQTWFKVKEFIPILEWTLGWFT